VEGFLTMEYLALLSAIFITWCAFMGVWSEYTAAKLYDVLEKAIKNNFDLADRNIQLSNKIHKLTRKRDAKGRFVKK